jgi:hypothetical protein
MSHAPGNAARSAVRTELASAPALPHHPSLQRIAFGGGPCPEYCISCSGGWPIFGGVINVCEDCITTEEIRTLGRAIADACLGLPRATIERHFEAQ